MTWVAPRHVIKKYFVEFIGECKKSRKDGKYVPKDAMFFLNEMTKKKKPDLLTHYGNWMKLEWVQESIDFYIDDFMYAKPYINSWLTENTAKMYKLSLLYGPNQEVM